MSVEKTYLNLSFWSKINTNTAEFLLNLPSSRPPFPLTQFSNGVTRFDLQKTRKLVKGNLKDLNIALGRRWAIKALNKSNRGLCLFFFILIEFPEDTNHFTDFSFSIVIKV